LITARVPVTYRHPTRTINPRTKEPIMTNTTHKGWTLADPTTNPGGFWFILRPDGTKYGQTQTEAAARIMRRRAIERNA
jgi:hypothetical protein